MHRAAAATIATVLGLVLLLSFKTTGHSVAAGVTPTPTTGPVAPGARRHPHATPARTSGAHPSAGPRTVDGAVQQTPFGTLQVQLSVSGGRITAVRSLQMPADESTSQSIGAQVAPLLAQEVITAQSARINVISGATYDSEGYAASAQSALDRIGG